VAYKLIAFDMDGTMLDDEKKIPEGNLRALAAAAERGCHIVPATGRMVGGMPAEIRALPYVRYYITMNGALVWDEQEKRSLFESEMSLESVLALFEYLDAYPVSYDCYRKGQGYISAENFELLHEYFEAIPQMISYVRSIRTPVPELKAALRQWGDSVQKVQIYFMPCHEELRQELLQLLPGKFPELAFTTSLKNNIEVNSAHAGKDRGLAALCRELGIDMADTVAFGDGSNDSAMLKAAGLGVCMANGCDEAKAAADIIAKSNNEAGLALCVEKILAERKI